ncbi:MULTISPECIES: RlmE family RNA methyltransferase [Asticcacaulis]|jgi:23S rRNA (uridine2552-2'-O)-methyltransferase|uniref:Ribosomal RNA large subunit methyltransferase E n=1 Tax=Asticcacaulis excentricus (strain ATCC 15261 / DSM 4724 / KCTC 12464 / NCIMB 9791 / VKM B-1370 / CB 48) TaxID=573065 RepID=E8RS22_ASTEC|nr:MULTISPECIES: RlmE family RNA methyltransferase [Asticcacaulis]ADU14293.1 ribosomal RNA methyltransferase RrmJ/FtsJ [Asticcacaulis excentricus CB 48]MCA1933911.1 RlmE family RNA methyltransferase [Asticcacaulis sp.]
MSNDTPEEPRRRMVKPPAGGNLSGRAKGHTAVKTAKQRTQSSAKWLERQLNDPFVQKAKAEGWRSRAAFKLQEIDDRFHILKRGARVVDLGCAPGGWVQMAQSRGAAHVVGVDLLPVDPIPGADMIEADFTDPAIPARLMEMMGDKPDVVLSDLAHNTVGHRQTDHLKIMGLLELASDFALDNLKPGGAFVAKAFQGGETEHLLLKLKLAFRDVKHFKPKSSRADSSEIYIVAQGFKG